VLLNLSLKYPENAKPRRDNILKISEIRKINKFTKQGKKKSS